MSITTDPQVAANEKLDNLFNKYRDNDEFVELFNNIQDEIAQELLSSYWYEEVIGMVEWLEDNGFTLNEEEEAA